MKTTRLIIALFIAALGMSANAQELGKARNASDIYEKINVPAVSINVRGEQKLVLKTLQDVLKKDKLKGKESKGVLKYEKASLTAISNDYLNLFFKVTEVGEVAGEIQSTVSAFVSRGANSVFVSPEEDRTLMNNLKNYLENKFYPQMQSSYVQDQTDMQNDLIKATEKQIASLEKTVKNREEAIREAEDNITKYKKEIEDSNIALEDKNNLLNQQKDKLRSIK
jgi:DNA-directed RNA polymerase subunit L